MTKLEALSTALVLSITLWVPSETAAFEQDLILEISSHSKPTRLRAVTPEPICSCGLYGRASSGACWVDDYNCAPCSVLHLWMGERQM